MRLITNAVFFILVYCKYLRINEKLSFLKINGVIEE